MDPQVVAAIIAAAVSVLTLVGTLIAQYLGRLATSRDTEKTLKEQREHLDLTLAEQSKQLDRTLAEQNIQLDRTLAEQRTRTLNGSPRRPTNWAVTNRLLFGSPECMPWRA
jgi:hypothetical protein